MKTVLALNPDRGVSIPGHGSLRKMRVQVPGAKLGKRGGYRCIYRKAHIDEIIYIVILEVYYKGDSEDLSNDAYDTLEVEAAEVLSDPLDVDWEDVAPAV